MWKMHLSFPVFNLDKDGDGEPRLHDMLITFRYCFEPVGSSRSFGVGVCAAVALMRLLLVVLSRNEDENEQQPMDFQNLDDVGDTRAKRLCISGRNCKLH